jgi:hypothetical protein
MGGAVPLASEQPHEVVVHEELVEPVFPREVSAALLHEKAARSTTGGMDIAIGQCARSGVGEVQRGNQEQFS